MAPGAIHHAHWMAKALYVSEVKGTENPPKRIKIVTNSIKDMSLTNFVTMNFCRCLDITTYFLQADPDMWNSRDDYKRALEIMWSLKVVNDTAEGCGSHRGIQLLADK